MAREVSEKMGRALALLLLASGHSDTQILQAIPGVTEADLKAALRFLHRRLAPPDPVIDHLRADLRAAKRSPRKARATTGAHRERVWRAYCRMDPSPKREDVVRLCRVSLGFAQAIEGPSKALERNGKTPSVLSLAAALRFAKLFRSRERHHRQQRLGLTAKLNAA